MKTHEKDIFIVITTDCNLKCFGCGYGCNTSENPWYITKEEYLNILNKLKDNQVKIENCDKFVINITGGEPLLHPQAIEFAELTRQILPEAICFIATNGLLLDKIPDRELKHLCNDLNIKFGISLYPNQNLLKLYDKIDNKKKYLGLKESAISWNNSHLFFGKISFDPNTNNNLILRCKEEKNKETDYIFIYKNKIYNCQQQFQSDKLFNTSSGIDINLIKQNQDLKKDFEINCNNCKSITSEWVFWHQQKDLKNYYLSNTLLDLYLNHYEDYYTLQHDCKEHLECLKNNLFKNNFSGFPNKEEYETVMRRFFTGKADIFISYNDKISKDFISLLFSQNIFNQCNIYLICTSTDLKIQKEVYENFHSKNNVYFLKGNEPIFLFLNNSYLKIKIRLKTTDIELLKNENYLLKQIEKEAIKNE